MFLFYFLKVAVRQWRTLCWACVTCLWGGSLPVLCPHSSSLLLYSSESPSSTASRANSVQPGFESFLLAKHYARCCRVFRGTDRFLSWRTFQPLVGIRQLHEKPGQRLWGFQWGSKSAKILRARSSQYLIFIGQGYFIKRSLTIYNY